MDHWLNQPELVKKYYKLLEVCRAEPEFFVREVLGGDPWEEQVAIMNGVRDFFETGARSCHGIGKSKVASWIVLWWMTCWEDSIVLTTAPTFRQVEHVIWREIRSGQAKAIVPLSGEFLNTKAEVSENWFALGLSTKDPNMFQGFHAKRILVIADESSGIPEAIFEAIDGVTTSQEARILHLGNPTNPLGRFARVFKNPATAKIHVPVWATPNFVANGIKNIADLRRLGDANKLDMLELPRPYLVTPSWAYKRLLDWGEDSPMWQSRAEGNFPEDATDTIIPLYKVEAAMSEERKFLVKKDENDRHTGLDVARFGDDKTVFATRLGLWFKKLIKDTKKDTHETASKAKALGLAPYYIDEIGVGGGVVDNLKAWGIRSWGVVVNRKAKDEVQFADLGSELWWKLRDLIDDIYLPFDEELLADLSDRKYKYTKGKIKVEEKSEVKKRRKGRSPDAGDAVILSFADYLFRGSGGKVITGRKYSSTTRRI